MNYNISVDFIILIVDDVEDEEMIRLAFRALDKDGSGTVSTKEFKHLMTHLG